MTEERKRGYTRYMVGPSMSHERQFLDALVGYGIEVDIHKKGSTIKKDYTKETIKEYFVTHPGASNADAAYDLSLSISTISHHRSLIRKDWLK